MLDMHRNSTTSNISGLDHLTLAQVADYLNVSTQTVRRLIRAGSLVALRTSPSPKGHFRIPRWSVERFLAAATAVTTGEAHS